MIRYLSFFIILYLGSLNASEVKCNFEEVYQDGQVQQGIMIMKGNLLRYQYLSPELFTIFHNGEAFYALENNNHEKIHKINNNTKMLEELIDIASKFPEIERSYIKNNYTIDIELSLIDDFVKRLSIRSNDLNMSIFFNNCKFMNINERIFVFDPLLVNIGN